MPVNLDLFLSTELHLCTAKRGTLVMQKQVFLNTFCMQFYAKNTRRYQILKTRKLDSVTFLLSVTDRDLTATST